MERDITNFFTNLWIVKKKVFSIDRWYTYIIVIDRKVFVNNEMSAVPSRQLVENCFKLVQGDFKFSRIRHNSCNLLVLK